MILTKDSRPPSLCRQCTAAVFLGLINTCCNRKASTPNSPSNPPPSSPARSTVIGQAPPKPPQNEGARRFCALNISILWPIHIYYIYRPYHTDKQMGERGCLAPLLMTPLQHGRAAPKPPEISTLSLIRPHHGGPHLHLSTSVFRQTFQTIRHAHNT